MNRMNSGLLSLFLIAGFADAAAAADVAHGGVIAKRWCATCHVVASDQRSVSGQPAPFSTIGRMPELDSARLALFLLLPHPKMPDMNLTRDEAADLTAYIASQGK